MFWSTTILGGRGWTEPAKETPVRSTSRAQIQVERSNHVPGFHSCLAPTPATHFFTASVQSLGLGVTFRGCGSTGDRLQYFAVTQLAENQQHEEMHGAD